MLSKLLGMVSRGRIALVKLNPKRALVQIEGLADETKDGIELLLPHGMSAKPKPGADVALIAVSGSRAHLLALFADDSTLRIQDLAEGEFGFRDASGQQIVFRTDKIEITTPLKLAITVTGDADIEITGNAKINAATLTLCEGTKKVALDGDDVVDGKVVSSATKVTAA